MSSATGPKGKQWITQKDKNHLEIHRQNVASSRIMEKKTIYKNQQAKCRKKKKGSRITKKSHI